MASDSGRQSNAAQASIPRRALLAAAGVTAVGAVAAGSHEVWGNRHRRGRVADLPPRSNNDSPIQPPRPAVQLGFSSLSFHDEFDSPDTIERLGTGKSPVKWYVDMPFHWATPPTSGLSVSDSVLTILQPEYNANWAMSTVSPRTGKGFRLLDGYVEAKMAFPSRRHGHSTGFPAFWAMDANHICGTNDRRWGEVDIFEAQALDSTDYDGDIFNTVIDWQLQPTKGMIQNAKNRTKSQMDADDFLDWHIFACGRRKGEIRFYLDGRETNSVVWGNEYPIQGRSATQGSGRIADPFGVLDGPAAGLAIIFGSAPGWPLYVDWMRVWT